MKYAWIEKRSRSIFFLFTLMAIAGLYSAFKLPVTLFPNADFPRMVLTLETGDRPAEQMEIQVTIPVEDAVRRVAGVKNVRSTTSRGSAEISIDFDWGQDMAMAVAQVTGSVTQILPTLPANTRILTRRMDPTVFPILAYSLTSKTLNQTQLYDLAQYQLRPLLSGVKGIARIQISGGAPEEYRVTVDPARLASYGLTIDDVSKSLASANVISAVGRLEDHYKLYLVITDSHLQTISDIGNTILIAGSNGLVRLKDVAGISDNAVPQWIRVTADGRDAVLINIYQQPDGNSVAITKDVHTKISEFQSFLPKDVKIAQWYDQSHLVTDSATSVRDAVLIGIVLAAIVLFIFLRDIKIMLIAMLVVPAALASTIVLLMVFNMSFNIMTLGGMAAAVGLIIDDAIVMIEHIASRLSLDKLNPDTTTGSDTVLSAASQMIRPLIGSSASTIVVFIPLAFINGLVGAFFKALSLTMVSSLILSFALTLLVVPLLARRLSPGKAKADSSQQGKSRTHRYYRSLLTRCIKKPLWTLLGILLMLAIGTQAYLQIGSGFMPTMDEGGFILDYRSHPGTSLTETDRILRQVEDIIKSTPEIASYSRRTGIQLGGSITEANEGDFLIRLKDGRRRPVGEIMDEIRGNVEKTVPGIDIELAQLMEDLIGDLTAVPEPIEIKIFADDTATLSQLAIKTADALHKIPNIVDIKNGINPAGDALEIHVDKVQAAVERLDPDAVSRELANNLTGNVATEIRQGPKMVGVRIWIPQDQRLIDQDIEKLLIRAPDGHLVPVKRLVSITRVTGQPQISRENLKRMVAVTARISGTDIGTAIKQVKQVMDHPGFLPTGIYYELGGLYQQQRLAFQDMVTVFVADIAIMLLLLLLLYERFKIVLSIITVPLLSVTAVFLGLMMTGIELNISTMMGIIMVIGIVTEGAIFYFSEYQSLRAENRTVEDALIEAGQNRMRPIAMTTIVTILTLLPLAFAIGKGAEMQQPLAVAIICGLIIQLPLTLLVMPVIFKMLERD